MLRRSAEGVQGPRIALEAAVAIFLTHQVFLGSLQHGLVHVVDLGHVAELHEPISGESFMGRRRAAEPLVTVFLVLARVEAFERRQHLVTAGQQVLGSARHFRLGLVSLFEVIENEQVRVVAGRGLLEATARLAQHRFQTLLQVGQGRRIEGHLIFECARNPGFG